MQLIKDAGAPVEGPRMTQAERRSMIEDAKAIKVSAEKKGDADRAALAGMVIRLLETG